MANNILTGETSQPESVVTPLYHEPINERYEPSSAAVRSALADAISEPEPLPTRTDAVLTVLLWALYAGAVLAVVRGLWAAAKTVGLTTP